MSDHDLTGRLQKLGCEERLRSMDSDLAHAAAAAVAPGASAGTIARAAELIEAAVARASDGADEPAYQHAQAVVYELVTSEDPGSWPVRDWLAGRAFAAEEARFEKPTRPESLLTHEAFVDLIETALAKSPRYSTRIGQLLESDDLTEAGLRVFVQHQWYRSRGAYRIVADYARRQDLDAGGVVYANLAEEVGVDEASARPHPFVLSKLLSYFDLDPQQDTDWPEAHAYVNNRTRVARSGRRAEGLSILWYIEAATPLSYPRVVNALRRLGVPDDAAEFYHIHSVCDEAHAAAFSELTARLVTTLEEQRSFFAALERHRELGWAYYRRIATAIEAVDSSAETREPDAERLA